MSPNSYRDRFLRLIPERTRSHITNLFLQAVRQGAASPDEVVSSVVIAIHHRVAEIEATMWTDDELAKFETYLSVIREHAEKTLKFAEWALWWEALPAEERARLKGKRAAAHVRRHMEQRPPSERQLKYLRSLGCRSMPASMAEASEMIDHLLSSRGLAR